MTTVTQAQIDAATTALDVQKLQARIQLEQANAYEAELAAVAEHRARSLATLERQTAAAELMVASFRQQATAFDASERGVVVGKVFDALVGKYMSPGTGTDPATQLTDATRDANYLKVAVQQAMAVYDALRTP